MSVVAERQSLTLSEDAGDSGLSQGMRLQFYTAVKIYKQW